MDRTLLCMAVTRAAYRVVLVGSRSMFEEAIRKPPAWRGSVKRRLVERSSLWVGGAGQPTVPRRDIQSSPVAIALCIKVIHLIVYEDPSEIDDPWHHRSLSSFDPRSCDPAGAGRASLSGCLHRAPG